MITVILPTRNNLKYLKIAIQSFYESTDYPFEMVVMVNNCTDGTIEWLNSLPADQYSHLTVHISNMGRVESINWAIEHEAFDDVYIIQDDVLFHRCLAMDWLEKMKMLSEKEEIGIATSMGCIGTSDDTYIEGLNWVGTWGLYIPRKTIERIGLLDPQMIIGDDIDYSWRVQKEKLRVAMLMVWHEHHELKENGESFIPHSDEDRKIDSLKFRRKHGIEKNSD